MHSDDLNKLCDDCGALNPSRAASCWMCQRAFSLRKPNSPLGPPKPPGSGQEILQFLDVIGGALAGMLTIALGVAVIFYDYSYVYGRGLLVILFLVAVPGGLAALGYVLRRWHNTARLSYLELFIGAFGGAIVLSVLGLAVLVALFIACMQIVIPPGTQFH